MYNQGFSRKVFTALYSMTKISTSLLTLRFSNLLICAHVLYIHTFNLINETFFITDRVCTETCDIGPYRIPKDMVINISVLGVHYSDDFWADPETFDPDR